MSLQKEDQQWWKEKIAPRQASQAEIVWLSPSPGLLPTQLWGALVSALVQWGREAGIEVLSPSRAVEMAHSGDRRHVSVHLTSSGHDALELQTIPQTQDHSALWFLV